MFMNENLFIDFLNNKEILWLGINFQKARFTRQGFDFSQEILQHYFHDWNMMIINDQKKYDIRMSFRKPVMQYDLSMVTKVNKSIRAAKAIVQHIDIKDVLTDEAICEYMPTLTYPTSSKYALSIVVESFDSSTKTAALWVVIVKTDTGDVVLCEKFLKVPGGLGARNYWARTFYNLFYDIRSASFLRWENMVQNQIDANQTNNLTN